ncbi:MAG: hypothetical protein ACI80V_001733 [Rhodothermales bacterium]|jgi:hypothetical protein
MEHIGSGWQFDAYASGGRVHKVPVSELRMAARVVRSYPALVARPFELIAKIRQLISEREDVLAELASREVDRDLLANFREQGGRYVQDRVEPLGGLLSDGSDPYRLMDRYVTSIHRGWVSGLAETSFNFTVNHGLNKQGSVVIIDVGELSFSRDDVEELVAARFWEGAYSVRVLPQEIRSYLLDRMATEITPARLIQKWQDARYTKPRERAQDRPAARRARTGRMATLREADRVLARRAK